MIYEEESMLLVAEDEDEKKYWEQLQLFLMLGLMVTCWESLGGW